MLGRRTDSVVVAYVPEQGRRESADAPTISVLRDTLALDGGAYWWWPITRSVAVPADKITFAGSDEQTLEIVMKQTAFAYRGYSSFHGFAIHFAQSYQDLVANSVRDF
jgi:hypothetical protein